ncbi:MAG: M20/M25/M40 family metallo-hydrolase [Gemmatimonadota bacterium]|nr:M20/M25/M40 family metallo-hydrolase [Gemmatimonadota bacterium]
MRRFFALAVLSSAAASLRAQPVTGYSAPAAQRERAAEADAIKRPDPGAASALSRALSHTTHIAGTPAQAWTRDYVVERMKSWGLETEVRAYDVWMPHTTAVTLSRVAPDTLALRLSEGPVAGDSTSLTTPEAVIANGTSGTGDVTGEIVYVNYGLIEDYAQLDSLGVSVKGKIAVARYGRSFRGIKAREAERHGALGLIIYSDPQDDGFVRGDVYPAGPMRPPQGVQRGSVYNGNGDPSTPGWPSKPGAKRLAVDKLDVPRIPVVPIGYGNASELLRGLHGARIPQTWQGGLPFRYHIGPGPVAAHLVVQSDTARSAIKQIWDTFGIVRGSELPDQYVIIGGHRDGWGPGAADNVSGTVSVLEAARSIAEQVKGGMRPRRTIIFATWDAEEWGLVGSTEYVEDDSLRLGRGAVAYLNQDVAAGGPSFGGGGSPSLRAVLRDVAREVPDPTGAGSVYDVWRRKSAVVADSLEPPMGDPGGGSDFAGFYNHLGIPIADWGFGGPGGVYHSFYDSYHWMESFGDPGFLYHATAGRLGAAMALRLANAELLPYDYLEYARTMRRYLPALDRLLADRKSAATSAALGSAIDRMERAASAWAVARDAALAGGTPAAMSRANASLLQVERSLTRPQGLRTRPWYRNLIYAADEDNGYATMVFPSVSEAVRAGDRALVERELQDLASRFDTATAALASAAAAIAPTPAR